MSEVAHHITGAGEPILLLHAFGLSGRVWKPVEDLLATDLRVITVDLPAHGNSPLPGDLATLDPAGYARAVARLLDELEIDRLHIVGNSIGGWTALELALLGRAKSVTALSPAGLWPGREPLLRPFRFVVESRSARLSLPVLRHVLRTPMGRSAIIGAATASDLPADVAIQVVTDYASIKKIEAHVRARAGQRFRAGQALDIPVTVAWGAEDRYIPLRARSRDQLPAHARWFELPGCGHVMMYDDPERVARTIRDTIRP